MSESPFSVSASTGLSELSRIILFQDRLKDDNGGEIKNTADPKSQGENRDEQIFLELDQVLNMLFPTESIGKKG